MDDEDERRKKKLEGCDDDDEEISSGYSSLLTKVTTSSRSYYCYCLAGTVLALAIKAPPRSLCPPLHAHPLHALLRECGYWTG
jgi:hypothetical protein